MDSIRVGIRVRPLLDREKNGVKWTIQGENAIVPTTPGNAGFEFDHVFGESSTTDQIYNTITRPIVHSVMEGFNGTVFAYGQTSSGKTFTMMGTEEQPGVIPMAIKEIFDYIEDHDESEFIVRVSYLEIYKESICDLLDPTCSDIKIREYKENHVVIQGNKEYVVTDIDEVSRVIYVGNINRTTGETKMNDHSSRSHAVLSVMVESHVKDGDGTVKLATLNLVDLAGSERLNATGAAGKRAQEGIAINKSLFTLKQVISKLSEGNPSIHIPYRDSKLTHLLKPSLGGNAKTAIICAITPAEFYETELTLNFAICAMKVKNRPMVNEVLGGEEALKKKLCQLEKENGELRCKLSSSEACLTEEMRKELMEQIEEKQCRQTELEARIHSLEQIIIKSKSRPETSVPAGHTGNKSNRRRTICPASLARGMGSPLILRPHPSLRHSVTPVVTPEITNRSVSRIKQGVHFHTSPSGDTADTFQSFFNSSGFERELDTEMISRTIHDVPVDRDPTHPRIHVHVRDLERRRTMFRCTTFVMEEDTPASKVSVSTSACADQSQLWQEMEPQTPLLVDAQVQTDSDWQVVSEEIATQTFMDTAVQMEQVVCEEASTQTTVDTASSPVSKTDSCTQTEAEKEAAVSHVPVEQSINPHPPPPPSNPHPPPPSNPHPPPPSLNSSICLCSHYSNICYKTADMQETIQFHKDELVMVREELEQHLTEAQYELTQTLLDLQAEREKSQSLGERLGGMTAKLNNMEMATAAQEEYLTKLCQQSKVSSHHHGDLEDKCSQLERQALDWQVERERWEKERENWEEEQRNWGKKCMDSEMEQRNWEKEREDWEAEREKRVEECSGLEEKLEKEREEQEKLEKKCRDLEEEQEEWETEREGRKEEHRELEVERGGWMLERESWEREREEWKVVQESWEAEKKQWKDELEDLYRERETVETERENWQKERDRWESEREELKAVQGTEQKNWRAKLEEVGGERERWEVEREGWKTDRESWREDRERWEREREMMVSETCLLKEQLQSLRDELEKLPSAKRRCSEPPVTSTVNALVEKLQESEIAREKEAEQFQRSYQQKVRELRKAQEAVLMLQEQLEETTPPAVPEGCSVEDQLKLRETLRQREKNIQEKEAIIASLQDQLSTLSEVKTAALEQAKSRVTSMEQRLELSDERLQEALVALQAKMVDCDGATQQLCSLQSEVKQSQERDHEEQMRIQSQLHTLSSQLNEKEEEVVTVKTETAGLREEIAVLTGQITQLAEDHAKEMTGKEEEWQEKMTAVNEAKEREMAILLEKAQSVVAEKQRSLEDMQASLEKAQRELAKKEAGWREKIEKAQSELVWRETEWQEMMAEKEEWQQKAEKARSDLVKRETEWQEMVAENEAVCRWKLQREVTEKEKELQATVALLEKAQKDVTATEELWEDRLATEVTQAHKDSEAAIQELYEEINVKVETSEWKVTKLQSELESTTKQLHKTHAVVQEKEARIKALGDEVKELKEKEDTLYGQIADCATDFFNQIADKEEVWETERRELYEKIQAGEETITGLRVEVTSLRSKLDQAQQKLSSGCPVALMEAQRKIRDLEEQNTQLKTKIQLQLTYQPSHSSAGAICCDSSGTVTSAAVYHLRGELKGAQDEKARLETRVEKLKKALLETKQLYTREQEETDRYRLERNIFRAKYTELKKQNTLLVQSDPTTTTQTSTLHQLPTSSIPNSSKPPTLQPHPTQLPTSQPSITHPSRPSTSHLSRPSTSHLFQPPTSHPPQPPTSHPSQQSTSFPSQPLTLSKPPLSSLPTPKNNPRKSIFSYVPPTSHPTGLRSQAPASGGNTPQVGILSVTPKGVVAVSGQKENAPPLKEIGTSSVTSMGVKVPTSGRGGNVPSSEQIGPSSVNTKGGSALQSLSGLQTANLGEHLWDVSLIQTGPQPPRARRDQVNCSQQ